ncbi:MAG: DUF3052 domain-containing protein [Candidatus Eisenbacteria bacterium]|uniref:DUF3052 domain-containing protein n=1 Tax=Eiseniibacteriota bacterium TaxID=2212470 RepID=A0A933SBF5_UNCEI|nr:DUF3052 domain-containing protein [Candidatus Eisenbacteria bacterium]
MPAPPGYSGTPLAKKLGIAEGTTVLPMGAPAEYRAWLAPLPEDVAFARAASAKTDVAHVFVTKRAELEKNLKALRAKLRPDVAVWVSWPKKTSRVPTDVTEDVIRAVCLPMGWVDIKVCAVTEVWSGLKLVVRKELR